MKLDEKLIDSTPIMSYGGEGSENKETSLSHDERQEGLFHLITHSLTHLITHLLAYSHHSITYTIYFYRQ